MRWLKSPAPSRRAPARSALIGISMRRASTVPAMIATASPSPINSAIRNSWSRIGASACAVGCSKNTNQPSFGIALAAVSTEWPSASVPEPRGSPFFSSDCDLRQRREVLADLRALGRGRQHLAAGIDHIGERSPCRPGRRRGNRRGSAEVDIGERDAGIEAGMRHRDRHDGAASRGIRPARS